MPTLDLYKERKHATVILKDQRTQEPKEFKIPNEYTVEEIERLLELQKKRTSIESENVGENEAEQLQRFWSVVFEQLEILFQHYQPELTADDLRSWVTHQEALEILGFYDKYRLLERDNAKSSKKKVHDQS